MVQRPCDPVSIVPPAVRICEASSLAPERGATAVGGAHDPVRGGISPTARILRAMRRPIILVTLFALLVGITGSATGVAADRTVRILTGAPTTLDPAAQGDSGSAAITAQLFESLTAFDAERQVRPALAESWQFDDGGRRVTFHLRDGLQFSDGSPLRPSDVARSWLRLIDPAHPSPLASIAFDIVGAEAYLRGQSSDPASVGIHADDAANDLVVELVRPATDFVNIVAGPSFSVVPPSVGSDPAALQPGSGFVASGGYVLSGTTANGLALTANPHYWAGQPAVSKIELVGDLGGGSPVEAFENGQLDYAPISSADAPWVAYDETLGPQLIEVPTLSVEYYGFTTTRPPFNDVRVRQAFGEAVDWRRMVQLADSGGDYQVANSMVPPGIPGRSATDFLPKHDPADARRLLAEAGFPGGVGFPDTVMLTGGSRFDQAIVDEVKRELGITLVSETMGDGYFTRLATEPPQIWSLGWVADYPGRNDFLGVLLGTGATNNYGGWSSPDFDQAIGEAVSATDPAVASAAYDRAETIVRDEVPVVPLAYGTGWALVRTGLLGAGQNGLGIVRMAGLAWAD
jgi:oligopeptide transport system substrate-binding protein